MTTTFIYSLGLLSLFLLTGVMLRGITYFAPFLICDIILLQIIFQEEKMTTTFIYSLGLLSLFLLTGVMLRGNCYKLFFRRKK